MDRGTANGGDETRRQVREGVRARVADLAHRARAGIVSPNGLVALLSASALTPIITAAGGITGATAVATAGGVGAIGSGVLSGVIDDGLNRLRSSRGDDEVDPDDIEGELAERIEHLLVTGGETAQSLREEIAAVLSAVGAAEIAIDAAREADNAALRDHVTDMFEGLALDLAALLERLRQQDTERRNDREVTRQILTKVMVLQDHLTTAVQRGPPATIEESAGPVRGWWQGRCPYQGLAPFREEHSEIFFGREQATAALVDKAAERLGGPSVVVVTGPSGAGKSSLLAAGLMPALGRGLLGVPSSDRWPVVSISPGARPLDELATRLATLSDLDAPTVRHSLGTQPDEAHLLVRQAVQKHGERLRAEGLNDVETARLVLVVDQFEQIFSLERELDSAPSQSDAFIAALMAAATPPAGTERPPSALVVLCVRGDHWQRCAAHPQLVSALQDGQFVVGPMSESELRMAVAGPASLAGLAIEDGLVDHVLDEVRSRTSTQAFETAALPLLSQAMLVTWEHREAARLSWRGYEASGGVAHAVRIAADKVYDGLTPSQQDLARAMFVHLTAVQSDGTFARRRGTRDGLAAAVGGDAANVVDDVLDAFTDRRLLVRDGEVLQISHDVLLEAWPRLRDWLLEDHDVLLRYNRLLDRTAAWLDESRDPSFLYRGAELLAAQEMLASWEGTPDRFPTFDETSRLFIAASTSADRQRRRRRRVSATALALVVVLAVVLGSLFTYQRQVTQEEEAESASRELAALSATTEQSDPSLSMMLALAAYERAPTEEAERALFRPYVEYQQADNVLAGALGEIRDVDASADGRVIAARTFFGAVTLWIREPGEPTEMRHLQPGEDPSVQAVDLDLTDDGEGLLLTEVNRVALYDTTTGSRRWELPLPGDDVRSAMVRDDGSVALQHFVDDFTLRTELWELADGEPRLVGEFEEPTSDAPLLIGFGPDPDTLVLFEAPGGPDDPTLDQGVVVWDAASDTSETVVDSVSQIAAVTPDGVALVCRAGAQPFSLVDLSDGTEHPVPAPDDAGCADQVAIDANAEVIATSRWATDLRTEEVVARVDVAGALTVGADLPMSTTPALFSDGDRHFSVSYDESRVVPVEVETNQHVLDVVWIDLTPDGEHVVSVAGDGSELVVARSSAMSPGDNLPPQADTDEIVARVDRPAPQRPVDELGSTITVKRDSSLVADRVADDRIQVRRLPDLELLTEIETAPVPATEVLEEESEFLVFHGDHLVSVDGASAQWWDTQTGDRVAELDLMAQGLVEEADDAQLQPHRDPDLAVYWVEGEPDIHVVETATGEQVDTIAVGSEILVVQFQSDAPFLGLLRRGGFLEIWDLEQGDMAIGPLPGTGEQGLTEPWVAHFVTEPGQYFVGDAGWLNWYDATTGRTIRSLELGEDRFPISLSADGDALVYRQAERYEITVGRFDTGLFIRLDPEVWQQDLCSLLGGREFTADELQAYPMAPGPDPCR